MGTLRRRASWLGATMAVGGGLDPVLKDAVARPRPVFEHPVALAAGYSFPSGHALTTMLLAACIVLLTHGPARGRPLRKGLVWAGAVLVILITGADRVGLGVHYVTDVLAGWLAALITVTITTTAFETGAGTRGCRRPPPDPG